MKYLLGLDYGTGGAKACIIDENAEVMSYAFKEYPIYTEHPYWSEHDTMLYWTITCNLIHECIEKTGINPASIVGVGTSSALPSLVMVDNRGDPVNRAYNLMDRRALAQVQQIKNSIGQDRVFELTGNRLDDHPLLVNLMWEKSNRPESFVRVEKALTIDGFIRHKLTGVSSVNFSAAAFYGVAYNIRSREFDRGILNAIGISPDLLPRAFACDDLIGTVTAESAKLTGLVPGTPVAAGQVDCNAGWVGAGAIGEGDIQMNLGTCGNFGVVHRDTVFLESMIACAYTTDSKNTYVTIPTTTTGGQLMRYLRDNFSHLEVATERLTGIDAYDQLNREAEKTPAGSDGLVVLPYLMGERTPLWDAYARGVVFGLSLSHTKGHLVRAMMESVAYALFDSFQLVKQSNKKINYPIVLNEGGAKSVLWRRIITDVFNTPTVMVKSRIGAPYGDALLAGVSVGVFKDFSIAKEKAEYVALMEPNEKAHNIYMDYFGLYKNLYTHLKQDFRDLSAIKDKHLNL